MGTEKTNRVAPSTILSWALGPAEERPLPARTFESLLCASIAVSSLSADNPAVLAGKQALISPSDEVTTALPGDLSIYGTARRTATAALGRKAAESFWSSPKV